MRVLGIETSGDFCGVAIVDGEGVAGEIGFRHRMELSQRLLPAIDSVIARVGLRATDVQGVAVSLGPGSFTGLRIGVTTAKAFAWSLNVPVVGVSTLAALAASCRLAAGTLVCPLIAANEDRVFAGLYEQSDDTPIVLRPPALLSPADLSAALGAFPSPVWFAGATEPHRPALSTQLGSRAHFAAGGYDEPAARVIAALGRQRLVAGENESTLALAPLYLRPSAAEARRSQWLSTPS